MAKPGQKNVRILVELPRGLKAKLDCLKSEGHSPVRAGPKRGCSSGPRLMRPPGCGRNRAPRMARLSMCRFPSKRWRPCADSHARANMSFPANTDTRGRWAVLKNLGPDPAPVGVGRCTLA